MHVTIGGSHLKTQRLLPDRTHTLLVPLAVLVVGVSALQATAPLLVFPVLAVFPLFRGFVGLAVLAGFVGLVGLALFPVLVVLAVFPMFRGFRGLALFPVLAVFPLFRVLALFPGFRGFRGFATLAVLDRLATHAHFPVFPMQSPVPLVLPMPLALTTMNRLPSILLAVQLVPTLVMDPQAPVTVNVLFPVFRGLAVFPGFRGFRGLARPSPPIHVTTTSSIVGRPRYRSIGPRGTWGPSASYSAETIACSADAYAVGECAGWRPLGALAVHGDVAVVPVGPVPGLRSVAGISSVPSIGPISWVPDVPWVRWVPDVPCVGEAGDECAPGAASDEYPCAACTAYAGGVDDDE